LISVAVACGDYSIQLPGGYRLSQVYAGAVHIVRPDQGIAVHSHVDRYAVVGHLVVGHVTRAEHEMERSLSRPGYFILDTKTGTVKEEVDLESWLRDLRRLGVADEPALSAPSRFHRDYE
jgi:hypothetical protein